ncbi:MAG: hypothetical protein ACSHX4_05090 [Opitutaceae bacterium]
MSTETPLPELHQTVLTPDHLNALFNDLESCTEILLVMPKAAPGYVGIKEVSLEEGKTLLVNGSLRGLQIRYQYQGAEWWDTLINRDGQIHITRIQQNFQNS